MWVLNVILIMSDVVQVCGNCVSDYHNSFSPNLALNGACGINFNVSIKLYTHSPMISILLEEKKFQPSIRQNVYSDYIDYLLP